jgi:serine/threonine-protein phosphatase 2B regulatory subunit
MGCGSSTQTTEAASTQSRPQAQHPAKQEAAATTKSNTTAAAAPADKPKGTFTEAELAALKLRFKEIAGIDTDDDVIDKKEFLKILKFEDSLFTDRVFSMFDTDQNGTITQEEFIEGLAMLSPNGSLKDKIQLSFRMWDLNNNGVIEKDELKKLMQSSMDASSLLISDEQVEKLIDATFGLADCDNSGAITLQEYEKLVHSFPSMIVNMTLNFKLDAR